MILTYHPAFDVYHCVFRLIRLLSHKNVQKIECDKLRILDFYLLFSDLIKTIRLKRDDKRWSNELVRALPKNKYNTASVSRQVFEKLSPFHSIAIKHLIDKRIVSLDDNDFIIPSTEQIPDSLRQELERINKSENNITEFLCGVLNGYQLLGKEGLKNRTGLMEYKYDAI